MDKKNGFRNLSLSLLVKLGVSQPGEELVADSLKAKVRSHVRRPFIVMF